MIKLHFFYFSFFAFILSIFVNCVGEPRGVANWAGSGKKQQTVTSQGRDLYIAKNQKLCQSQNSKWKNFAKAEYWHLF